MDVSGDDRWPNFFIIGAQKAGTSSLYQYLGQHPQIFMSPIKEAKFFFKEDPSEQEKEDYLALFEGAENYPVRGEATPLYLSRRGVAQRIHSRIPEARMVVVLRDPVERAYSAFLMTRREGTEPLSSFSEVLEEEPRRRKQGGGHLYLWHSRYYSHLQRYFKHFDREQVRIYLFEDFKKDEGGVLNDILEYLSLNKKFNFDTGYVHNKGGLPISGYVHRIMRSKNNRLKKLVKSITPKRVKKWLRMKIRNVNRYKPRIEKEVRKKAIDMLMEEIKGVEEITGRDLSMWKR